MSTTANIPVMGGVEITSRLGAGGMGEVYLGRHLVTGMQVAIKLVRSALSGSERFLNEARLGLGLSDPHLVRVYNAGEEQGQPYIVMELLPGGTVKDRLQGGRIPWDRAVDMLMQAARGLAALHRAGVIHRDIKPSNMMFAADGSLKLTDFGLARHNADAGGITRSSDRLGSPAYTAPEQVLDPSDADARSDIYSLGISFYEMLVGQPPFRTPSETDVCFLQVHKPLPDIRSAVPELPGKLVALLQRMTAKDPLQRPADGTALVQELQRLIGGGTCATTVMRRPYSNRAGWAALFTALCVLFLPGFAYFTQSPRTDAWQSPERAVFLLPDGVDGATAQALHGALQQTGLNVVERSEIKRLLEGPEFTADAAMDPASAVRMGHLVGGHIALFARAVDGSLALRIVEVETTLLRGSALATPAEAAAQAQDLVAGTAHRLPAQGTVLALSDEGCRISVGRLHGVRVGDRFQVYDGSAEQLGSPLEQGVVSLVELRQALLRLEGGGRAAPGAPVERIPAP
jgi:hypothetical protein